MKTTSLPPGFAVALGLSLILPLLNYLRDPPLPDFFGEWASAICFALGALFLLAALPRRVTLTELPFVPVAVVIGVVCLHLALGSQPYAYDGLLYLAYFGLLSLALLTGQLIRANKLHGETASRLAWALILAASVNLAVQLLQVLRIEHLFAPFAMPLVERSICRIYGNVAQANHANTLAWLAIAATIYLVGVGRVRGWLAAIVLAAMLVSSALTASRMAWLFFGLVALLLLAWRSWPLKSFQQRLTLVAVLGVGLAITNYAAGQMLPLVSETCSSSVERLADTNNVGTVIRKGLWEQAVMVWQSAPWIGTGPGSFLASTYLLDKGTEHRPFDTYAHNDALQTLAELGLIGAGALAMLFGFLLLRLWQRRVELDAEDAVVVAWLGIVGGHGLLEFPLRYVYFLQFFAFGVGLLVRPEWFGLRRAVAVRPVLASGAVAVLVGCAAIAHDYLRLNRLYWLVDMQLTMKMAATGEVSKLLASAADGVNFFVPYVDHSLGITVPLTRDELKGKIADTDRLIRRSPQEVTIARRVVLSILDDDGETARVHLRRLFVFFPRQGRELAVGMRDFIRTRPKEFEKLGPLLDEELARAPKPRW